MSTAAATTAMPDAFWGYLVILGMAMLFHDPWRWLGVALGRDLDMASPLFAWVRSVATALVGGLVMRLTLFPAGALGKLPAGVRVGAFAVGIAVFALTGRKMAPAVLAGAAALIAGALLGGA